MNQDQFHYYMAVSKAFSFFADLFQYGPKRPNIEMIMATPDLKKNINCSEPPSTEELDELAAEHFSTFGPNIFPNESYFLSEKATIDAGTPQSLAMFYGTLGFDITDLTKDEASDHIAIGFQYLSHVADLIQEQKHLEKIEDLESVQRDFLDHHLFKWIIPFFDAIMRENKASFYKQLSNNALQVLIEHRERLSLSDQAWGEPWDLTPFYKGNDFLDQEKTGIQDIVEFLLIPSASGIHLSKNRIKSLGSESETPSGFGDRKLILKNLILSGCDYDSLDEIWKNLLRELDSSLNFYKKTPVQMTNFVKPWIDRVTNTVAMIERIKNTQQIPLNFEEKNQKS